MENTIAKDDRSMQRPNTSHLGLMDFRYRIKTLKNNML
jgi:hypothetical protein